MTPATEPPVASAPGGGLSPRPFHPHSNHRPPRSGPPPQRSPARPEGPIPPSRLRLLAAVFPVLLGCQTPTPAATTPSAAPPAPAAATPSNASPTTKRDEPNTLHGIYSEAQAARGAEVFDRICSECHEAADWTDPAFLERWEEASVFRLWHWVYERMPHGNPGTLAREQVTDALAYIFQLNGLPAGPAELASDDDSIDDYWIIWSPNDAPILR